MLVMAILLSCRVLAGWQALAEDSIAARLLRGAFEHRWRVGGRSPPEAVAECPSGASEARRLSGRQHAARLRGFEKVLLARVSDLVEEEIHPRAHGCISYDSHPPPSAL